MTIISLMRDTLADEYGEFALMEVGNYGNQPGYLHHLIIGGYTQRGTWLPLNRQWKKLRKIEARLMKESR